MPHEERKSILVVTLSNIGDVILTTPVIYSLRTSFPSAKFTVVAGPRAAPLLEGSRMVDRLLIYDKFADGPSKLKLVRALREEFYDWVIDLRNSAIPYLVRADRRSPIFRAHHEKSARGRHLEVLAMTGLPIHEEGSFDFFSAADEASLAEKLRGKGFSSGEGIVVAPGAGSEAKRWRIEGFCEVAAGLLSLFPFSVFAVGDAKENFLGEKIAETHPARVINFSGGLSLREWAALVSSAKLVLTNDSAAMHLGHELGRPVVALFGPTDPEKYGRESEIWRLVREPDFQNLSAEKVFEACKSSLRGAPLGATPCLPAGQGQAGFAQDDVASLLAMTDIPLSPRRILVTRTDRLGDLVLSTPVFEALRRQFPEAHIACLTFLENRAAVEGNPNLNEVILYDKGGSERGAWGNFRFARRLAQKRFDVVIHLHPTNRMHLVGWLAGIPVRIGYDKKNGWALTHKIKDRKAEGTKHESEYNFDLIKFLGIETPEKITPHFPLKEKDEVSLSLLLRNLGFNGNSFAVLNPSASCPSKIWPGERFARLADALREKYGLQIVLIGASADRHFAKKVKECVNTPHPNPLPLRGEGRVRGEWLFDLCGKLSIGMLGWLLKKARLLISNDSGPVHVARAVGTPVISIFGRNLSGLSPRRWGPLGEEGRVIHKEVACPVCLAHRCRINFLCLDVISVEDVLKEVDTVIASPAPATKLGGSAVLGGGKRGEAISEIASSARRASSQ